MTRACLPISGSGVSPVKGPNRQPSPDELIGCPNLPLAVPGSPPPANEPLLSLPSWLLGKVASPFRSICSRKLQVSQQFCLKGCGGKPLGSCALDSLTSNPAHLCLWTLVVWKFPLALVAQSRTTESWFGLRLGLYSFNSSSCLWPCPCGLSSRPDHLYLSP